MTAYEIIVDMRGIERYAIDASGPAEALRKHEDGLSKLKDDETYEVFSIRVFERDGEIEVTPVNSANSSGTEAAEMNEIVSRSAPRWAWEMLDEYLGNEPGRIHLAFSAIIAACERADDAPISITEAKSIVSNEKRGD